MHLRLVRLAAATLAASPAAAADHDAELWTTIGASGPISGRFLGSVEAIARFSDDGGGLYEAEFGGFLGYRLTGGVALWAGYVRAPRYSRGASAGVEDRTRQQVTADLGMLSGASVSGRVRLEQRFRDGGRTGWRLRPQLRVLYALSSGGLALVGSHESFVAFNDTAWGQRAGYERMRNFIGFSVPLAARIKAEAGYLNQYNFRSGRDTVDHASALTASYSF